MEILHLKRRMVDILHEKLINRELVIVPVDILKEIGCISEEGYQQWTKSEITTLDDAFKLPVSSIRELAFYLRGLCRRYDHALLRNFLKDRYSGEGLKVSKRNGLNLLLSDAMYVKHASVSLRRTKEKSLVMRGKKSAKERSDNKTKHRSRKYTEKAKHTRRFCIVGVL